MTEIEDQSEHLEALIADGRIDQLQSMHQQFLAGRLPMPEFTQACQQWLPIILLSLKAERKKRRALEAVK